jgi:hypothetical protein
MKGVQIVIIIVAIVLLGAIRAHAQRNIRASIDTEREGLSYFDDKTLEKSRSFIRRDSSYYVGWLYNGAYLFFRANDKLGFTKAIVPLKKCLGLIEREFDKELRTRSNNYAVYSAVYNYHRDYGLIAYLLDRCYQNVEMPDKAIEVLRHVVDRNFQLEQNVTAYNTIAWIYHRNRVYTSRQFPFLRNSVKENVTVANKYLDSALLKMQKDNSLNTGLFDPSFLNGQYLGTFHYKALIEDYKLEIDSANYFYNILIENNAYSSNNYAEFKLAMGELDLADEYFKEAEQREYSVEKTTKEYYYMRGTLNTYRGHPEEADTLLRKVLDQQGSTPGYGWHCIGLARALHYEGLTAESQDRNNKAARFQELHIGTTWGQEQYNMAVASLTYINHLQFKKEYFFENDQWWFWLNPVNWYHWIKFSLEVHHYKMILASMVAENPEREQVIYSIFSSENLISFDEINSVIDGFGNEYFINIYKKMLATDKRPRLKKYIRYFLGKLYLAEGDESEAKKYFEAVLADAEAGDEYQSLLVARVYEGLAMASSGSEADEWTRRFYNKFPQLVPFSQLTMNFKLEIAGAESGEADDIVDELKECNIDFSNDRESPVASIAFTEMKDVIEVRYTVERADRSLILQQGTLRIQKAEIKGAGKLLAYRFFGIIKKEIGEKPEVIKADPEKNPV